MEIFKRVYSSVVDKIVHVLTTFILGLTASLAYSVYDNFKKDDTINVYENGISILSDNLSMFYKKDEHNMSDKNKTVIKSLVKNNDNTYTIVVGYE